jgi:non-ribosomal peptide synthase protein (TIGR01720 family)
MVFEQGGRPEEPTARAGLAEEVQRALREEGELLLDPDFFAAYAAQRAGVAGVDVRLKRAADHNELSRYRYDVVLTAGTTPAVAGNPAVGSGSIVDGEPAVALAPAADADLAGKSVPTWPWTDALDVAGHLAHDRPDRLRLTGIPNARLTEDLTVQRWLQAAEPVPTAPATTAAAVTATSATTQATVAQSPATARPTPVDPEQLQRRIEALGYRTLATWNPADPAAFDLMLIESSVPLIAGDPAHGKLEAGSGDEGLQRYANQPVAPPTSATALITSVRVHAQQWLPDYMVPAAVVVLDRLPVLVSGKLDRSALPAPDPAAGRTAGSELRGPRNPREQALVTLFADVLGLAEIGVDDDFFALGGDSIVSIQLVIRARQAGLVITPRQVFVHRTVAALAPEASELDRQAELPADAADGDLPLTPILRWLDECGGPIAAFSQSMLVVTPAELSRAALAEIWTAVTVKHPVLVATLVRATESAAGFLRVPEKPQPGPVITVVPVASVAEIDERLDVEAEAARTRLDPATGVMAQLVWFEVAGAAGRLLLVLHHAIVDGVSWRILLPDLAAAWSAVQAGGRPELEQAGSSFRRWSQVLQDDSARPERIGELDLWTSMLTPEDPRLTVRPLDRVADRHSVRQLTLRLSRDLTDPVLGAVPAAFHAGVNDVLLTALALAVADWRRRRELGDTSGVLIALEGHGREEDIGTGVDLSRTLGWFTSVFPVRLDPGAIDTAEALAGGPAAGVALKRVKEQLRGLPDRGVGFGGLRYLNPETAAVLAELPVPQLSFNYLGRFTTDQQRATDTAWTAVPGVGVLAGGFDDGMPVAPYALEVNAFTEDGADGSRLGVTWAYPETLFTAESVQDLADTWFAALAALVTHTIAPGEGSAGGHTPSDLTLSSLSQEEIDEFETEWELQ